MSFVKALQYKGFPWVTAHQQALPGRSAPSGVTAVQGVLGTEQEGATGERTPAGNPVLVPPALTLG